MAPTHGNQPNQEVPPAYRFTREAQPRSCKKPKTYEITRSDGKKVRVTVPENDEQQIFDAIREQLSPHAVAAIASCLQINRTNNSEVDRQVHWFAEELCKMLGGHEQQSRLAEELGL
jgi:hypothetical protein